MVETIEFSTENLKKAKEIIARYPDGQSKSALLPLLHLAQSQFKWMKPGVMEYVAQLLSITEVEVYEVATFYTMFHLEPVGENVIEYCRTGPCCTMGGEKVYEHLQNKLEIKTGQTTKNGKFTLKEVECLAACGWGPCFQIREKFYTHLTEDKVDTIINELNGK